MFDTTQIDRDDVGLAVGIGTASALTVGGQRPLLVGLGSALLSVVTVLAFLALQ